VRHFETQPFGQRLDGFRKGQLLELHQEAERGAVRAAAEAVVELLVRAHPEGGRLLVMKGQQALYSRPAFFSGTRLPMVSTISARAISSSMKPWECGPPYGQV